MNFSQIKSMLPKNISLVAVTKGRSVESILELYNLGQRDFGENRIQELQHKDQALKSLKDLKWHMIGTLQNNKVKKLLEIERLVSIHSVDSASLADELIKRSVDVAAKDPIGLFWQWNVTQEKNKHGFAQVSELAKLLPQFTNSNFYHQGLMCMGPAEDDQEQNKTRLAFASMSKIKVEVTQHFANYFPQGVQLSMGMSGDYKLAIEHGSDWLRLGSVLFN